MFNGRPAGFSMEKAFEDSFGGALKIHDDDFGGESHEYYNPWTKNNKASLVKASLDTQTGGAGTAGTALIPVWVDDQKYIVRYYKRPSGSELIKILE